MLLDNGTVEKINFEFEQIDVEIKLIEELNRTKSDSNLVDIQIRAAASCIHSIYNGIEKIIVLIFKNNNLKIPNGNKWHSNLLVQAREKKIVTVELETELREIMGFRHFFRHAYGFMLDKDLLEPLTDNISKIIKKLKNEILQ